MKIISSIISNILTALYQPFGYAVFSSVLLCFFYLYACHPVNAGKGVKAAFKGWMEEFKSSVFFRKLFVLFFFTMLILFRTLFNRNKWVDPLSDIMGDWWIWETVKGRKKLDTGCIENFVMMLPFTFLLLWTLEEKVIKSVSLYAAVRKGIKDAFLFSFTIEMLQLLLRLGTWQLSDLVYNTIGGGLGAMLYFLFYKIKRLSSKTDQ